jgi:hypothetical protein
MAMWAAVVGVLIHKELAAAERRTPKANSELAMACTASAAR